MKESVGAVSRPNDEVSRAWRSRTVTKALLLAGIVAAGLYVFGDVLSGLIYSGSRPYSFKDQWISELTAYGSPVRPLMVTVITVHDLLLIAFGVGIWRAAGQKRSLRWCGIVLIAATTLGLAIHPFFPMNSRWIDRSFTDTMHQNLSIVWSLMMFVAVALSAVAYRGRFRLYAIVTDLVLIVFGAASGNAIQGIEENHTPWAGAFERINAYALMAWFVVLAMTVMRRCLEDVTTEEGGPEVLPARAPTRAPAIAGRR